MPAIRPIALAAPIATSGRVHLAVRRLAQAFFQQSRDDRRTGAAADQLTLSICRGQLRVVERPLRSHRAVHPRSDQSQTPRAQFDVQVQRQAVFFGDEFLFDRVNGCSRATAFTLPRLLSNAPADHIRPRKSMPCTCLELVGDVFEQGVVKIVAARAAPPWLARIPTTPLRLHDRRLTCRRQSYTITPSVPGGSGRNTRKRQSVRSGCERPQAGDLPASGAPSAGCR